MVELAETVDESSAELVIESEDNEEERGAVRTSEGSMSSVSIVERGIVDAIRVLVGVESDVGVVAIPPGGYGHQ